MSGRACHKAVGKCLHHVRSLESFGVPELRLDCCVLSLLCGYGCLSSGLYGLEKGLASEISQVPLRCRQQVLTMAKVSIRCLRSGLISRSAFFITLSTNDLTELD